MSETIAIVFTILIFVVFPAMGIAYSIKLSQRQEQKRDTLLKKLLSDDVQIKRGFPIDQNVEEIIQGGLRSTLQQYRELIIGKKWLFIQVSSRLPAMTLLEDRRSSSLSLYAYELEEFTPTIVIRNSHNKSFLARYVQESLKNGELIWCEAAFDADHNIYNKPGSRIDTLSILSPEVIDVIRDAPGNADIMLKRNQIYYMLPGRYSAEKILPSLIKHSDVVVRELNSNLNRCARSTANREALQEIKASELSVTQREQFDRGIN